MSLKDTTTDLNTLRALLERVEGATGELPHGEAQALVGACQFDPDAAYLLTVAITDAPLNATGYAVAFFEAVLPGHTYHLVWHRDRCFSAHVLGPQWEDGDWLAANNSLPLAIVAATLKALIAKAEGAENGTI